MTDFQTPAPNKRKNSQDYINIFTPEFGYNKPEMNNTKQQLKPNIFSDESIYGLLNAEQDDRVFQNNGSPRLNAMAAPFTSQSHQPSKKVLNYSPIKQSQPLQQSLSQTDRLQPASMRQVYILSPGQGKQFDDTTSSGLVSKKFPSEFNPRQAANMPHREKVDRWIVNVPAYPSQFKEIWFNECYPSVVDFSTESSPSIGDVDFTSSQDIIEFQSRMITFFVNKSYYNDATETMTKGEIVDEDAIAAFNYSYDNSEEYNFQDAM
ncbi:hypothetical protein CANARDRAFT_17926 [[Candida] arabinofermentans NRRL YB-2248]|uniref:Uncharacterized protein n=1 Tax=[Candida] arabinofermentans NRRL YB-2248 TaxID=983967 RepID=A0A1E4SZJ2_9ASCO|nr:hypothetical protein CANARDRAFT_17926 [[Candida] arabinofermentans NRRL YB-2248]